MNKRGIIISRTKPDKCPRCGSTEIYQEEDVLDTWFSSWLWPFATLGWPKETEDLNYFYPTSVLVTAPEILFFWVARMIMAGLEFTKEIPFRDVYIHGTVRDIEGRKMSKSLGNIIDPLEIIEHIGADALRFSLISITAIGQDVFLSEDKFKTGRNFCNKIWNASRLILMNLEQDYINFDLCEFFKKENLSLVNRWILSSFYSTLERIESALKNYNFNEYVNLLYRFFWHQFCDWYLEIIKPKIKEPQNQLVMYKVLEKFLRCLHPVMPFITEEIWQKFPSRHNSIMVEPWPHIQKQMIDKKLEKDMESLLNIISSIRNLKTELKLPLDSKLKVSLYSKDKHKKELINSVFTEFMHLAGIEEFYVLKELASLDSKIGLVIDGINVFVHLPVNIDISRELQRINQEIKETAEKIKQKEMLLKNSGFIKNAPSEVIRQEEEKLEQLKERKQTLEGLIGGIKSN